MPTLMETIHQQAIGTIPRQKSYHDIAAAAGIKDVDAGGPGSGKKSLGFIPITKANFMHQAKKDKTDKPAHTCQGCGKKNKVVADGVCFSCYNDPANS